MFQEPAVIKQHARLARMHLIESTLAEKLGSGVSFRDLAQSIVEMSTLPMWALDPRGRLICSSEHSNRAPQLKSLTIQPSQRKNECLTGTGLDANGISRQFLLSSIKGARGKQGWLIMQSSRRAFSHTDYYLMERGTTFLQYHQTLHRSLELAHTEEVRNIIERILHGESAPEEAANQAHRVGISLKDRCVVVVLHESSLGVEVDNSQALANSIMPFVDARVVATRTYPGLTLVINFGQIERVDEHFLVETTHNALSRTLPRSGIQCGVSEVVTLKNIPDAFEDAVEVVNCLKQFPSDHTRIFRVGDLGPVRLLIANSNNTSLRRYVLHTLGKMWKNRDDIAMQILLDTLSTFLKNDYSIRKTASALAVHENTVRQRLARIESLTGRNVRTDPSAQLSFHTALTVVRLSNKRFVLNV